MTTEIALLDSDDAHDEAVVEKVAGLVNAAYAIGEEGLWLEGTPRIRPDEITETIRRGELLAATVDGEIAGCAYVRPLDAGTADLGLISVAPERWGGGVGRQIVSSAEELMRTRGATTMQLELLVPKTGTHPAKERLHAWYTRLGYRVVRSASIDEVAAHLAPRLATPCEFLIFRKKL